MMTEMDWKAAAEAKRLSVLNAIPKKWQIQAIPPVSEQRDVTGSYIHQFLTAHEIEITETDAAGIVEQTISRKWSAVEVTEAFCHRAALAHQLVNCLHEIFFDAAIEDAKQLDAYYAEHGKPSGPLHGLPVSLKDQFHVQGVETTMGYVGWIGTFQGKKGDPRSTTFESELVRELRSLGAVLYCKTSVPVTLMMGETANGIIGYTWNPRNRYLSSGGSSGGEGALIALRGSPGGFGTDIGGSIRVPAGFNYLYGLRPSSGRVPYEGAANSMDGQISILPVVGPLATTARSIVLLFKAILSQEPWNHDPLALEVPWRNEIVQQTQALIEESQRGVPALAFAIVHHNGHVRPHPPVARGLKLVEQTLKRLGHRIIEWNPPASDLADEIAMRVFCSDAGTDVRSHFDLSGERPTQKLFIGHEGDRHLNAMDLAALNVQKREYQKLYMEYWNSTVDQTGTGRPVDGFISPVAAHAAVIPGQFKYIGYTVFANVLDYTSVVLPVTHADKQIDIPRAPGDYLGEIDKQIQEDC
ncbi:hypothetical protein ASPZODRAFT_134091, partial [Penicilliopsis zonata CBS 506.65]